MTHLDRDARSCLILGATARTMRIGGTLRGRGWELLYPGFRILRHEHQPRYIQYLKGALGDKIALLHVRNGRGKKF